MKVTFKIEDDKGEVVKEVFFTTKNLTQHEIQAILMSVTADLAWEDEKLIRTAPKT